MKTILNSIVATFVLTVCVSCKSRHGAAAESDVHMIVEVLEYRVDDSRSQGTDSEGKYFEWHYDTFRFRVLQPGLYYGQEWQIMLPFLPDKEHLARIPAAKAKIVIRIDSDALKTILDPSRPTADMSRWPTLESQYVFRGR